MKLKQSGIAVITVLLALALGVLICSEIITRVYTGVKRSANQFNALQASEYALSGEAWARQRLYVDWEKQKEKGQFKDHLHQEWAMPAQRMDVEGGTIEIEIYDLHARFNLNSLIDANGAIVSKQVQIFSRLLANLGIVTSYANMAGQWANYSANNSGSSGYATQEMPYREGNTQFGSISELRLLRDMDLASYNRLAPYISAIPILPDVAKKDENRDAIAININTAPEPILLSVATSSPDPERVRQFLTERENDKEGFSDAGKFSSIVGQQIDKGSLGIKSSYFEIRVRTKYSERNSYLISVVYRNPSTGEIRLLSRDRGQQVSFKSSERDEGAEKTDRKDGLS